MAAKKNAPAKAPRPGACGRYARKRLAQGLPEIADTLVKHASGGSVPHTRMLVQLTGLDRSPARRSAGVANRKQDRSQDVRPGLREVLLGELARQAVEDSEQEIG